MLLQGVLSLVPYTPPCPGGRKQEEIEVAPKKTTKQEDQLSAGSIPPPDLLQEKYQHKAGMWVTNTSDLTEAQQSHRIAPGKKPRP